METSANSLKSSPAFSNATLVPAVPQMGPEERKWETFTSFNTVWAILVMRTVTSACGKIIPLTNS